jgi:DNA-binding CsgD family transcriptional regulator
MTVESERAERRLALLSKIAEARDIDAAREAMDRLVRELGFTGWVVSGHQIHPDGAQVSAIDGDKRAVASVRAYHEAGLAAGDPLFQGLSAGAPVVTATRMFMDPRPRGPQDRRDEVVSLLTRHGLTNLGAVRLDEMRGELGVISVGVHDKEAAARFDAEIVRARTILRLAGTAYLAKLGNASTREQILTPAERGVLARLARGDRPEEIAEATGRSVRTVRHQIESARRRLGSATTVAAVALAIELGEIPPPQSRH